MAHVVGRHKVAGRLHGGRRHCHQPSREPDGRHNPGELQAGLQRSWWLVYSTSQSVVAGWNSYTFELLAENFTFATGSPGDQSFANTLTDVTRFEILAGPGGVSYASNGNLLRAGTSVHTVALDDIRAVPEPTTFGLVCFALAASLWLRKKITMVG